MTSRSLHFVISADGKGLITAVGSSVAELEKLNKAADKMAEKLSKADGGARAMTVLEASVKKLGGTSALTADQISLVKDRLEQLSSKGAKIPDEFAKLKAQMDAAAASGRALGAAQSELASKAQGLAANMGPLGSVLSAFGPAGLAAAAGIGAVAVVASGVAAGLTYATHSVLDLADKMSNLSGSTGIGVESLQKFQFAGAAVGVSAEQIGGAMQKFQKNLVDGSKESLAAISQLGLSREGLANMLPEDQLATVLEALNERIPNAANRTQIAMALLGKAGADLVPLGAGIKDAMASAEALGVVLSEKDIGAADALGDSIGVLGMTFGGLVNNIGAAVTSNESLHVAVEGVTKILGDLSKGVHDNRSAMNDFISGGVELFVQGMQTMVSGIGLARDAFDALKLTWMSGLSILGEVQKANLKVQLAAATPVFGSGTDSQKSRQADIKAQLAAIDDWKLELSDNANATVAANAKWADSLGKVSASLTTLQAKLAAVHGQEVKGPASSSGGGTTVKLGTDPAIQAAIDAAAMKWWDAQEKLVTGSEKASIALDAFWKSVAGPSDSEVAHEVEKIGDMFRDKVASGVEISSHEMDGLIKKLKELKGMSLSGFGMGSEMFPELRNVEATQMMPIFSGKGKDGKSLGLDQLAPVSSTAREQTPKEAALAAENFRRNLDRASDSLVRLGGSLGGFAGGLANLAGSVGQAFSSQNYGSAIKKGSTAGDKAAAGVGAAGDIIGIYQEQKHNMSAGGAAMGGAASGAKAGAAFGPYGVVIGAAVGALVGVLSGSGFRKMAKDAGKVLGEEITKETATAVEATKKKLKLGTNEATLLNISGAIGDKDPRRFGKQVIDLMDGIKTGAIPAKEGLEELAKDFGAIADAALKAGSVGDKALVGIIKRSRELGMESPEIKEFVKGQLLGAAGGVDKFVGRFSEDKGEGGKFLGGLALDPGELAGGKFDSATASANGKAQATIFSSVFWANVKEQGLVGAADAMKESFGRLKENLSTVFGKDQMAAIFGDVEAMMGLAGNELFRGAAEGAQGLKEALEGVANAGYLTVDSFGAFEQQAGAAFNQAVAGGASSQQALLTIAPLLQSLASAAENYSIPLDDATRSLIEQAKAAGIAFKTDPLERMAEATDRMVVALEKLAGITPRAAAGLNDVANAANNMPSGTNSGGGSNGYGGYGPGDIPQYADGGYVPPRPGGTIIRVAEAGVGEFITPAKAGSGIGGGAGMGTSMSWGDIHIYGAPTDSPEEFASKFWEAVRNDTRGMGAVGAMIGR